MALSASSSGNALTCCSRSSVSSRLRLKGIQCLRVDRDSIKESFRRRRKIQGAGWGVGRSFRDVFGKVVSLCAGLAITGSEAGVLLKGGDIDGSGVESAMCTGVEPISQDKCAGEREEGKEVGGEGVDTFFCGYKVFSTRFRRKE